jgi:hypothetical protein
MEEIEKLKKYLSEKQIAHLVNHGYVKDIKGSYHVWLNAEKTKSFPVVKKKASRTEKIKQAFRKEIKTQISNFRRRNNHVLKSGYYCPLTKKKIINWRQAHVDHIVPFWSILSDFILLRGLEFQSITLNRKGYLSDSNLSDDWQAYHLEHAQLQILSIEANLKKGSLTVDQIENDARYSDLLPVIATITITSDC